MRQTERAEGITLLLNSANRPFSEPSGGLARVSPFSSSRCQRLAADGALLAAALPLDQYPATGSRERDPRALV